MDYRRYKSIRTTIAVTVIALLWLSTGLPDKSTSNDSISKVEVQTYESVARNFSGDLNLSGTLRADKAINIKSETSGTVLSKIAVAGTQVKKGSPILKISVEQRAVDVKKAYAEYINARKAYQSSITLYEQGLRSSAELLRAEATYQASKSVYEKAQKGLNDTTIRAPFTGIVERFLVGEGDFVNSGTDLVRFVSSDKLYLTLFASEQKRNSIILNSPSQVKFENGDSVVGTVYSIGSEADSTLHLFTVEVEILNPQNKYVAGARASAILPLKEQPAHYISASILTLGEDGIYGIKTVNNGVVQFYHTDIVGGDSNGIWVIGLPIKANIIVVGQDYVQAGIEVLSKPSTIPQPVAKGVPIEETSANFVNVEPVSVINEEKNYSFKDRILNKISTFLEKLKSMFKKTI